MTQIFTDLRNTIEEARRFRYEPVLPITATNMQDAIDQGILTPKTVTPINITFAMSPYTPAPLESYLLVDTSGGAVTINLATAASRNGVPLTVKDGSGNAAANPITLVPNGAERVDGLAAYLLDSNYAAVQLVPRSGVGYAVNP